MPTTCCVVGGGPAGLVLSLLLARCGVSVTVLEKHGDFLRDFRGDTVHASTLTLLDQIGLGPAFAALPGVRYVTSVDVGLDSGVYPAADLRRLPGAHQHLALVPQWDLLDLLARTAREEPSFALVMEAEVTGLQDEGGRVTGVTYRRHGTTHTVSADLVVGCDGRGSTVRAQSGLRYRRFGVPMDVLWFRLPRRENDPAGGFGRITRHGLIVLIDRGDYFQIGFVIKKGSYAGWREQGIGAFRDRLASDLPWLADRVGTLASFDDVRLLDVEVGRLRRWAGAGLLCIGDAAHAMSPVGGVGINLAVQDAVATARILGPAMAARTLAPADLDAVQRRRWWPTVATQAAQQVAHRLIIARAVGDSRPRSDRPPSALSQALRRRAFALSRIPAYYVAIGVRPEEPPRQARRETT